MALVWSTSAGPQHGFPAGVHMSVPLWILLPVLIPVAVILAAVALQHLERIVLPPSQTALTNARHIGDPNRTRSTR